MPTTTALDLVPADRGPLTWLPRTYQLAWFGDKIERSPATCEGYMRDGWHWITWCHEHGVVPLEATPAAARAWIAHQRTGEWRPPGVRVRSAGGDAEATIARRVSSIANLYRALRGEGVTTADPLANVTRPRAEAPSDAHVLGLDARETARLLKAADKHSPRMSALLWLLVECGLRISEALGADIATLEVVRGHRTITVLGKGRRRRTVVIPPSAWVRLEAYLGGRESGAIFLTEGAVGRWSRQDAWSAMRNLGRRVGISRMHPHRTRHTCATLMLESGAPLDRVATVLGHSDIQTTRRYVRARERLDTSPTYGLAALITAAVDSDEDAAVGGQE